MEKLNKMHENLEFLKDKLIKQYGNEICENIIKGYSIKRKVTLRINTLKSNHEEIYKILNEKNIVCKNVDFYKDALIIENSSEKDLQELDIYKEGKIYLQSLSSMLPPIVLNPQENQDILDMTAAPGGKTTQISALTNNKSHITACELNKIRAERLRFNIQKQGATCVSVLQTDSRNLDDFFSFDKILLDAPCSGSGTINFNLENSYKNFSNSLVDKSCKAQKNLINKALRILKKGGELVYSTCSILQEENEEILKEILNDNKVQIVPIQFKEMDNIPKLKTKIPGTLCVCPDEFFEGFFVAKLKKVN